MIISFDSTIRKYYTSEEWQENIEIMKALDALEIETEKQQGQEFVDFKIDYYLQGKTALVEGWKKDYFDQKAKLRNRQSLLEAKIIKRYKETRKAEGILEDLREVTEAFTKEDFLDFLKRVRGALEAERLKSVTSFNGMNKEDLKALFTSRSQENYSNCFALLVETSAPWWELLDKLDKEKAKEAVRIIKERVTALGYEEPGIIETIVNSPEPTKATAFLTVLHGRVTDALPQLGKSSLLSKDPIAHTETYSTGTGEREVKAIIKEIDGLAGALGISTHKLLMVGIAQFAQNNHTGDQARKIQDTEVSFSLKEYAKLNGVDIEAHPDSSGVITKQEQERAKSALKNARKKANKDLEALYNFSLSWIEKVKGKIENFKDYRIIDSKGIENGYIKFNFAKQFSDYLIQLPLNQYPVALLKLDERSSNAYNIGIQLSYHLNNDNNIGKGTANRLKVKTLLEYTNLPNIEEVRTKNKSWVERIKEPLETALDALTACDYLENWEYTHPGGEGLTDEEAHALYNSFEEWKDTLISFSLKNAPNHSPRLEAKAQKIEEAKARKKPRRKNKPSPNGS